MGDFSLLSDEQLDAMLLAQVQDRWLKTARIVANALGKFEGNDGDRISERMEALVALGKIECAGDVRKWRFSEIRLRRRVGEYGTKNTAPCGHGS
jgi:uncharacterized protein DUF3658